MDYNRLCGVFIAGESITNMNNSTNIRKNSISFLGMPIGTRKSCLMIKPDTKNLVTLFLCPAWMLYYGKFTDFTF